MCVHLISLLPIKGKRMFCRFQLQLPSTEHSLGKSAQECSVDGNFVHLLISLLPSVQECSVDGNCAPPHLSIPKGGKNVL
jgi:hypothetical protein